MVAVATVGVIFGQVVQHGPEEAGEPRELLSSSARNSATIISPGTAMTA